MSKVIIIDDDEMDALGDKLDSQTYLLDGKKYKILRTDPVKNVGYYVLIK